MVSFEPMLKTYVISLSEGVAKQLRGLAHWSDGKWYEICEAKDGVTYQNHNPELISVDERGICKAIGGTGIAKVTLRAGDFAFEVNVVVTK